MEIKSTGTHASGNGPADYFTGTVRIDPQFAASPPLRVASEVTAAGLA